MEEISTTTADAIVKPAKPKAKKTVKKKAAKSKAKKAPKRKTAKPKKTKAKTKPKAKGGRKVGAVVRSERLDMRLSKPEKAAIMAVCKKTGRTYTSVALEALKLGLPKVRAK